MKILGKYSIGIGDRFGQQGNAQLKAVIEAGKSGIEIVPVWNKSNREHQIIGTDPNDVRLEADTATQKAGFRKPYFVDADHINLDTVDRFLESSDFFTIDVASYIGVNAEKAEIEDFVDSISRYNGKLVIPGLGIGMNYSRQQLLEITGNYLFAAKKAGHIYKKIEEVKGAGNFITEVSMDEVPNPQSPLDLFFILGMIGSEGIPLQTIAPKFSGRFNKGVDYAGDPLKFAKEFEQDLMIIELAIREFGLPENLKISIHSGSDKFALYPHIRILTKKHDKGVHLKTAGTTWLEEVIGLAEAGGQAFDFVKEIYLKSLEKIEELCAPYSDVINIDEGKLPDAAEVSQWTGKKFAGSLRHDPDNPDYNSNMRQLVHVAYKLAAMRIEEFSYFLDKQRDIVEKCVFENIYNRHICRLFDIS
jgi:hypothetical protein